MSVPSHNNSQLVKESNESEPDSSLSFSAINATITLLITSPDSNHKKEGGPPVKRDSASTAILVFLLLSTKLFFFFLLFQGQKQHRVLRLNTFRPPIPVCHTTKNHLFPAMAQIVTLLENFLSHRFGENLQLQ